MQQRAIQVGQHIAAIPDSGGATRYEQLEGETTYLYQLQAFARAAQGDAPAPTDPADAIANMRVIDAIYRAAGLRPRGLV